MCYRFRSEKLKCCCNQRHISEHRTESLCDTTTHYECQRSPPFRWEEEICCDLSMFSKSLRFGLQLLITFISGRGFIHSPTLVSPKFHILFNVGLQLLSQKSTASCRQGHSERHSRLPSSKFRSFRRPEQYAASRG